jgi:methanogenic corrinoid protein MtbC1
MRMVCDFFEFEGWDTYFLGAVTPAQDLVKVTRTRKPDLVCISATMAFGLPKIRNLIRDLHAATTGHAPRIMVGGLPFLINPALSNIVGADATAADARQAVGVAAALFNQRDHDAAQI